MNIQRAMEFKLLRSFFVLLFVTSALVSCNNGDDLPTGRLNVALTDAPFPTDLVAEANVTISKVEIRKEGEEDDSFITIMEDDFSANLLELTSGVTANLSSIDIPEGSYDHVRVHVSSASAVLQDGSTYDLQVPSTVIKIFIKPSINVVSSLSTDLLLDFDVAQSFVPKGAMDNITGFNFKPVIKATNQTTTGTLTGTVTNTDTDSVEGAQVSVFIADTLNTTSFTNQDGMYAISGLEAGMYVILLEAGGYQNASAEEIDVVAGNQTTHDFQLHAE
ncbi:DUF4382 domain-containing protein [Ekhidna sp.]|uniref:DUF4382 domain-containing protein n=1 Tax=Ekhidna sp. TaxID=2608089 RepID=UPI0032980E91